MWLIVMAKCAQIYNTVTGKKEKMRNRDHWIHVVFFRFALVHSQNSYCVICCMNTIKDKYIQRMILSCQESCIIIYLIMIHNQHVSECTTINVHWGRILLPTKYHFSMSKLLQISDYQGNTTYNDGNEGSSADKMKYTSISYYKIRLNPNTMAKQQQYHL